MTSWWKWRDEVVEQVRFWPDRKKIAEELDAHYEDHVKDLERIGFDHELAEERALQAMGDAAEVGKAMDKAHQPRLGWVWLVSKGFAILALSALFLMFVSDGSSLITLQYKPVSPLLAGNENYKPKQS